MEIIGDLVASDHPIALPFDAHFLKIQERLSIDSCRVRAQMARRLPVRYRLYVVLKSIEIEDRKYPGGLVGCVVLASPGANQSLVDKAGTRGAQRMLKQDWAFRGQATDCHQYNAQQAGASQPASGSGRCARRALN
ncbi:MAG: hypothetical protein K1Y01_18810 [Vicinamibacteria bacterium]|nr:hypothetical protein [Vicinamibacteria bacterium]